MVQSSDFTSCSGAGEEHVWLVAGGREMKESEKMTTKGRMVQRDDIELEMNIIFHFC